MSEETALDPSGSGDRISVLHVLPKISGTSIPVEIASAIHETTDVSSMVVTSQALPESLPDTIDGDQVLAEHSGQSYKQVVRRLSDEFNIVHTHHIAPAAKVGVWVATKPIHHVNTQHGHLHYTAEEKVKNVPGLITADTIAYNSSCTANSYSLPEQLFKYRAEEHVVHNGIDVETIKKHRAEIGSIATVATAARLVPRKNIGSLVRAFAHLERMELRIIGDGPQKLALERAARDAGVQSRVEFIGYLPDREDVYEELASADVFALPSHGEGFCVAAAEAMAIGLPVVVSDIPIFREVVGSSGVFVDRSDPQSIADSLAGLRSHPERAREIGRKNRERAFREFSLSRCARRYANVYRTSLEN